MISRKLMNSVDTLEAAFEAGQLDKAMFGVAMASLRDLADQMRQLETADAPNPFLGADLTGVTFLNRVRARRETEEFLDSLGVAVAPVPRVEAPSDSDPGAA